LSLKMAERCPKSVPKETARQLPNPNIKIDNGPGHSAL
jgi:hypothetical protein